MLLKMTRRLLLLLGLALAAVTAQAQLQVEIKEDTNPVGCPKNYPFREDNLRLFVRDGNSKVLELPFCSSYGSAEVSIERDIKEQNFVLLRYGTGSGTNVREEFMKVFKAGAKLEERQNFKCSAPSGFTSRWLYDFKVLKPSAGGLQFLLTLRQEGTETIDTPKEKQRVINVQ